MKKPVVLRGGRNRHVLVLAPFSLVGLVGLLEQIVAREEFIDYINDVCELGGIERLFSAENPKIVLVHPAAKLFLTRVDH